MPRAYRAPNISKNMWTANALKNPHFLPLLSIFSPMYEALQVNYYVNMQRD